MIIVILDNNFQIDKELESGEYFVKEQQHKFNKMAAKKQKQSEAAQQQKERRNKSFLPPPEQKLEDTSGKHEEQQVNINSLKSKVKKHKQHRSKNPTDDKKNRLNKW